MDGTERNRDRNDLKMQILDHLSLSDEAHFKSQQRGDPDLTTDEKRAIAESVLNKSWSQFLSKFGRFIKKEHLDYFKTSDGQDEDYEVNYHLEELGKQFAKPLTKSQIRNRRLEALRRLRDEGEYFSDEEMKRRNPLLYEELVGQYLTENERRQEEASMLENKSFESIFMSLVEKGNRDKQLLKEVEGDLNAMDEDSSQESSAAVVCKSWGAMDEDSQDSVVAASCEVWGEINGGPSGTNRVLRNSRTKEIDPEQKAILYNEFRSHVFSNFLVGKDSEFDYSTIDNNTDYDDLTMLESDQQDSYFDAESPKSVMDDDSNS